jgi:Tfp pilus assembly protein PilN
MNDTQLSDSMRNLPRVTASPAFTSEVMRAVKTEAVSTPRLSFVWRMAAGVAMAACLLAVVQLASLQYTRRQDLAQLRVEQQKLQAELKAIEKIAATPEPVVVFENSQGTRVIMDLDTAVQPASYRTFD